MEPETQLGQDNSSDPAPSLLSDGIEPMSESARVLLEALLSRAYYTQNRKRAIVRIELAQEINAEGIVAATAK